MLLIQSLCQFNDETSDGLLELVVLGGVDERVDAAVGIHQHDSELIKPMTIVHILIDVAAEQVDLARSRANDEPTTYHQ